MSSMNDMNGGAKVDINNNDNDNDSGSRKQSHLMMPAEWDRHVGCIVAVPHRAATYRLDRVWIEFVHFIATIVQQGHESVLLLVHPRYADVMMEQINHDPILSPLLATTTTMMSAAGAQKQKQQEHVSDDDDDNTNNNNNNKDASTTSTSATTTTSTVPAIHVCVVATNDTWARDTAPTFVITNGGSSLSSSSSASSSLVGLDWDFNAYGGPEEGCYWPCDDDRALAGAVCQFLSTTLNEEQQQQQQQELCNKSNNSSRDDNNSNNKKNNMSVPPSIMSEWAIDSAGFMQQVGTLKVPLVMEGGAIHVDGCGTVLTTKECLLNPNRNPHLSQSEIATTILHAVGASHMIWLDTGLAYDDDTNGHVDNFCCFIRPGHVVLAWTDLQNEDPENYHRCRHAMDQLNGSVDATGQKLTIHKLHLPRPMVYTQDDVDGLEPVLLSSNDTATAADAECTSNGTTSNNNHSIISQPPRVTGHRMAASYINYYLANQAVIVPQFGDTIYDRRAVETLQELFPDRVAVGVASREILLGGGNLHCITQQIPAPSLRTNNVLT